MTVEVVEVLRRSEQGVTRPFICRGDDNEIYFVKGTGAGRQSQISEWIAGRLGFALGLPIAPFEILNVPEELLQADGPPGLSDLGAGPAFGSRRQDDVMELTASTVLEVPDELQQDVLAFDWWIRNGDRMLTEKGGNPNLFWDPASHELLIIDHNQAFDRAFDPENFLQFHVFIDQRRHVFDDMAQRDQYNERFSEALDGWADVITPIPEEWFFIDHEMTVRLEFGLDVIYEMLIAHDRHGFWDTP